jgi:aspartate carbamoyltransferase catalytic subunit
LKNLFSIEQLSKNEINEILQIATEFDLKYVTDEFKHKKLVLAFFETSTRTKLSFEIAAKNLGLQVIDFMPELSSIQKGESLIETLRTLEAMGVDVAVVRHREEGTAKMLSEQLDMSIINAGDGVNQHPSQALLDALTLKEVYDELEGFKITICGDILHSRVARSNIELLSKFNVNISLCAPKELLDNNFSSLNYYNNIDLAVENSDVIMCLRIQNERMKQMEVPNTSEYYEKYGFKKKHFEMNKNIYLMHPGPVNYGVDIENGLQNHNRSLINKQVRNGVLTRMAILKKILNGIEK